MKKGEKTRQALILEGKMNSSEIIVSFFPSFFSVVATASKKQAYALLGAEKFDIAIASSDVLVGDMIDFTNMVKFKSPTTRILLSTIQGQLFALHGELDLFRKHGLQKEPPFGLFRKLRVLISDVG